MAGVDGCPGGWVAALIDLPTGRGGPVARLRLVTTAELPGLGERVAVDMPIGLPDGPQRRPAEAEARALLGTRRSSVFPTPVRAVLGSGSYDEACGRSRQASGRALSRQSWAITPAIAALDEVLADAGEGVDARVGEAHPEVAFTLLAGDRLQVPPKRLAEGRLVREQLLTGWLGPQVRRLLAARPRPARVHDVLDALACAWTAERWAAGQELVLGDAAARDGRGRPMIIRA